MTKEQMLEKYEVIKAQIPIYSKRELYSLSQIVFVHDLLKVGDTRSDCVFTCRQESFYKHFEDHQDKAFNTHAFRKEFLEPDIEIGYLEEILNAMVSKNIIKGVYYNGSYFYHY